MPRADFPVLFSCFPLAIYFTFGSVYMSTPLSHFGPPKTSPSLCPQVHSLHLHLFIFLIFEFYFIYFLYSIFLLVIHFIHISVYMSIPISQFIPPPPTPHHFPPLVSIHLFSTSVSLFLPCKPVHLYHFSRFHIYALIYGICFSPSDLFHSV